MFNDFPNELCPLVLIFSTIHVSTDIDTTQAVILNVLTPQYPKVKFS